MELKCPMCGATSKEGTRFCPFCGSPLAVPKSDVPPQPIKRYAENANEAATETTRYEPPATEKAQEQPTTKLEKIKAFERQRGLITNLVVIVCAVVVMMIALFAPIKLMLYDKPITVKSDGQTTITFPYANQSNFDMIEAVLGLDASTEKKLEYQKRLREAESKINEEYAKWRSSNPKATEEQAGNAYNKIYADNISDFNILGYSIANASVLTQITGAKYNATVTAVLGAAVAFLAIVMSIISLVYIIKSIVNLVKKRPQIRMYKYLSTILKLAMTGLTATAISPMLKVSGNMFGVALFTSLAFLICAFIGRLFGGKTEKPIAVKHFIIAAASMTALFALCGNLIRIVDATTPNAVTVSYVQAGYGLYRVISLLDVKQSSSVNAMIANPLIGIIMHFLVATLVFGLVTKIMTKSLALLASAESKKTNITALAVPAAVFTAIAIVVGLFSAKLASKLLEYLFKSQKITMAITLSINWFLTAGAWISAILLIGVAVFNSVFLPDDRIEKGVPVSLEQVSV